MRMIKKYLKKYMYLQKKDRQLLMIWDWYNNIIMENQKMINLLGNTPNQPSKFRARNWVEMNRGERMSPIMTLNLKSQWQDQVHVIIMMHTYMLKEL